MMYSNEHRQRGDYAVELKAVGGQGLKEPASGRHVELHEFVNNCDTPYSAIYVDGEGEVMSAPQESQEDVYRNLNEAGMIEYWNETGREMF